MKAAILNALPAHIALLDTQGTVVSVNAAWGEFAVSNHLPDAAYGVGLNYLDVCDGATGDNAREAQEVGAGIRSVLAGGPAFSLEYPCHSPAQPRWFLMTVTRVAGDRAHGAVVMHLDITTRRQTELELKEAKVAAAVREVEHDYHFLADAVPLIIWTARSDGNVDYNNKAWFDYTGLSLAQTKNRGWEAVLHPDDLARCLTHWNHSLATGEDYEIEYRLKRGTDASYRWFLGRASARRGEGGKIVQWVGTSTDIDERKQIEERLRHSQLDLENRVAIRTAELSVINRALKAENAEGQRTENALRESNEKFHQLADNITDAFWIRSPDLTEVQYVSPAFEKIWGRTVASLQADPHQWVDFIFAEDRGRVVAAFAELRNDVSRLDIRYRIVRPDGEIRWVRVRGFQTRDAANQITRHVGVVTDITEQEHANDALRRSEAEFRTLAEAMPQIVWITAPDGSNTYVNQRWIDYAGLTLEESYGAGWLKAFHPDNQQQAWAAWQLATTTGGILVIECQLRRVDATYRWWLIRGVPLRDAGGQILKWFGTCTDIHDLKMADLEISSTNRALQRQQTELRAIIDMVPAMIALKDADNVFRRVNQRFAAALGRTVVELEGKTSSEVFPQLAAQLDAEDLSITRSGKAELGLVKLSRNPNGGDIWHQTDKVPVCDPDGKVVGLVIMTQDITERKRAEEALRASEKRFKVVFNQAAVGVAQAEVASGRFLNVNPRFCEIVGRTREELEQLTFLDITHPQDVAGNLETLRQMGLGVIRETSSEKRYIRKDGSEVWTSLTVSAMWAAGDPPDSVIAVVQDISERKRLDAHLLQAQKMEALGQFSGGVAHDFNNILGAIAGYTELSKMVLTGNPEVREHLNDVLKASNRAADLVRQILTFSRQQPQERHFIDLRPVVAESLNLMRAAIPSTTEVHGVLEMDAPTVFANANQVHLVLMNIGINAWHAMKDRPGRVQVKLERSVVDAAHAAQHPRLRPGVYARVSVSDTGTGMAPATLRRIFEPFFTTKPPGEGTGLGLAVVHGIMDSHDAIITVNSQPGEGTTFHLYFPAHASEAAAIATENAPIPHGQGERILLVDDEELLVKMGEKTLTALGYVVEVTTKPVEALALVRKDPSRFALVITDQTMPEMTGLVLAEQLLQVRPGLPIILTTGYSASLTSAQVREMGICDLLLKPVSMPSLGAAVHAALHPPPHLPPRP